MKSLKSLGLAAAALMLVVLTGSRASAQNLFANPGFEDPITSDGPPFVGFWEGFSGGAGAFAANATTAPRSGAQHLELTINNTDNTFAGVFQDVVVTPGQAVTFSGFHSTPGALLLDNEMRIEWRNSVTNTEVSRTPNIGPDPALNQYVPFQLDAVVPAGADLARVVYAIQTFSGDPANTGTIFIDDVSFVVVPEPASLGMLSLGAIGLIRRRRA
jgi:hypothetical protein